MEAENRSRARRHIDTSVKVMEGKGFYHNAMGSNVSIGGLCFITSKPDIEAGQTFLVQFDLPLKGRLLKVEGEVKVVHKTNFGPNAFKVGLTFTSMDTLSAWNVESYVDGANKASSESLNGTWGALDTFSRN